MFLKTGKKLTIHEKYTPVTTFLSPVQKYNHRSFSASSLHPAPSLAGSLRDQIKLESFKKSFLTESKLNKTALNKATLKVHAEEASRGEQLRQEVRDLSLQVLRLKEEIFKLSTQHNEDLLLISRQNELLNQLEKELMILTDSSPQRSQCQCMEEEYILTIKNLEVRIRHLEEEKRGFKEEIRDLIVKQEELKFELAKGDERLGNEVRINRKLQNMIYEEDKQVKVEEKRERRGEKGPERRGEEEKSLVVTRTSNAQRSGKKSDLRKYFDELQSRRNKEIDRIENILNK